MTAQLLASELTNLIQESKRKHNDLRQAAEKSLDELKGLHGPAEAQIASELAQKLGFLNPFIIACGTKNAKFTGIAIVCLQRLIVARALPRAKLSQVLEALQQATSAGLDVQLKILQALPSLLSNYAIDLKADLLATALNICFILQSSKNAIVNNTSAATLQQLVVSVFDKVVTEDKSPTASPTVGEAPGEDEPVQLRAAALDAYRVFHDICLLTENQRPEYLSFSGLPQTFGLELIESVLTNHSAIINSHPEQANILRTRVMPFIISALRGKPTFSITVRLVRILYTILRRHLLIMPSECGDALEIMTHLLDQDSALWKRSLCMEVFRGVFAEPVLLRRIFILFDFKEGEKDILKQLTATFVRLATPRDAFLTTLGKAAVPPNVFTACLNAGAVRPSTASSVSESASSIFSNARGLLSVDSLTPTSANPEKPKQPSAEFNQPALNTRNLLCLRALLNLGIALGPTLSDSWPIILETLQQADFVLFSTGKAAGRTPTAVRGSDQQADQEVSMLLANFSTEIRAVETAASRLFESTVDFPNSAFVEVVTAVCNLFERRPETQVDRGSRPQSPAASGFRTPTRTHKRVMSTTSFISTGPTQEDQFALAKLGDLASINLERLLTFPPNLSGWDPLTRELIETLAHASNKVFVRARAADTLIRFLLEAAAAVASQSEESRGPIQVRLLEVLRGAIRPLEAEDREVSVATHATDVEIHKILLDGLKSILDGCGESLVSGWDLTFDIVGTIFMSKRVDRDERRESVRSVRDQPVVMTRSVKLIRPSFASLQLICSDFLSSLPNSCFLHLVDTLYKFCSQDDDLNVALTTITFFWAISDFLSGKSRSMSITQEMIPETRDEALASLASDPSQKGSGAALWMLLLLRLTSVTTDHRLELRNSAVQTLMRIMSAYGDSLSSEAWSICIRSVIFRLLSSMEQELRLANSESGLERRDEDDWNETAIVVIQGVADLLASYLGMLTTHETFTSIWQDMLGHFATMLDFQILDINAATYGAVRDILRRCKDQEEGQLNKAAIDLAWDLWSRGVPVPPVPESAMQHATPGNYASDLEYVTALQGKILEVFRMVRTDIDGVPSAMITQVADFVSLAFARPDPAQAAAEKRTYVAMSKESMAILQSLIISKGGDAGIYESGSVATAFSALARPIVLKYQFPITTKSAQPWKEATRCFLAVLEATQPHIMSMDLSRTAFQEIWQIIVTVANGIMTADCSVAPASVNILEDQNFDIASFHRLRELIIPALGAEAIPDKTRKGYAEGLFRMSIVHAPAPAEASVIYGGNSGDATGLSALYKPRTGRTIDPEPTKRSKMSEVCLDELFALVAAHDPASPTVPDIRLQPPTPLLPREGPPPRAQPSPGDAHALHVRLARTAAPYLILRCALSLRAYIADQPLRGRMPQPLAQRRELGRILQSLLALRSEPEAIPDTPNVDSEGRKHLLRLYPLLVGAVQIAGTAGDDKVLGLVREALEVVGDELGV
ncbi:hypothetical protein P8C59_008948 [Phyllachora maydis]|uniref:Endosomal peripheral membrane protein n=1 Tax=Phyllachora maydis TaxID=1825666 RepID=A0AAD9IBH7_9PEZI|nr:hypothetical protein P8C59_008948 [Phyllachora maydis]